VPTWYPDLGTRLIDLLRWRRYPGNVPGVESGADFGTQLIDVLRRRRYGDAMTGKCTAAIAAMGAAVSVLDLVRAAAHAQEGEREVCSVGRRCTRAGAPCG